MSKFTQCIVERIITTTTTKLMWMYGVADDVISYPFPLAEVKNGSGYSILNFSMSDTAIGYTYPTYFARCKFPFNPLCANGYVFLCFHQAVIQSLKLKGLNKRADTAFFMLFYAASSKEYSILMTSRDLVMGQPFCN